MQCALVLFEAIGPGDGLKKSHLGNGVFEAKGFRPVLRPGAMRFYFRVIEECKGRVSFLHNVFLQW
jgi:hypothetical protein